MIIIETCPKCGHDLTDEVICTYPPISRKVCHACGWSWTGEREEIMRVPFGGNSYVEPESILPSTVALEVGDAVSLNSAGDIDSSITTQEYPHTGAFDTIKAAKPYEVGDNLKIIEKLPTGSTSKDGCQTWVRRPTVEDIHKKIDEIVEVLNELTALHTKTGEILD